MSNCIFPEIKNNRISFAAVVTGALRFKSADQTVIPLQKV